MAVSHTKVPGTSRASAIAGLLALFDIRGLPQQNLIAEHVPPPSSLAIELAKQQVRESEMAKAESRTWRIIFLVIALAFLISGVLLAYAGLHDMALSDWRNAIAIAARRALLAGAIGGIGAWFMRLHITETERFREAEAVRRRKEEALLRLQVAYEKPPHEAIAILRNVDLNSSAPLLRQGESTELLEAMKLQAKSEDRLPLDLLARAGPVDDDPEKRG